MAQKCKNVLQSDTTLHKNDTKTFFRFNEFKIDTI